jgi:hypothetical protein
MTILQWFRWCELLKSDCGVFRRPSRDSATILPAPEVLVCLLETANLIGTGRRNEHDAFPETEGANNLDHKQPHIYVFEPSKEAIFSSINIILVHKGRGSLLFLLSTTEVRGTVRF